MQSANLFGPLKGLCPHKALIGLTQTTSSTSGYDFGHVLILNRLQIIPAFFFKQFDKEVKILTFFKEVLISIIFN